MCCLLWGYNRRYPGPTIRARKSERIHVKWINKLPLKHLLPVDKTIPGAGPSVSRGPYRHSPSRHRSLSRERRIWHCNITEHEDNEMMRLIEYHSKM
ncbi:multicopper oxidase domain-containing protein [Brevibacillus fortis]|uniref:multicopper oxidase domain-containing protein n=1 Tax=Brevibacillus fortis TaxID=2126352 RepID=UPI0038FCB9EA